MNRIEEIEGIVIGIEHYGDIERKFKVQDVRYLLNRVKELESELLTLRQSNRWLLNRLAMRPHHEPD